jgi:hypothetical protein
MAKTKFNKVNFFLFIISFLIINSQNSNKNNDILVLNFFHENKIYSFQEKDENFKIITKNVVYCIKAPCPSQISSIKLIKDEEDIKILKTLFDVIFLNSDKKEKFVSYGELPEDQIKIILMVLEKNKIILKIKYEILSNSDQYNDKFKDRGYTYEVGDNSESAIYTIAMGEKPSGGYSIEIKKVKINRDTATIYVSEKVPGKNEVFTEALTYPIVQIKFNFLPSFVEIINSETNVLFPKLK